MRRIQFPHFSRLNPAPLLWCLLLVGIAVNVTLSPKPSASYWDKLTTTLWSRGYRQEARNVLGATTDVVETLARREQEAEALQKRYAFWQTVAASHPDYRDAFVQLTAISYQLGKLDEARSWLARAATLDPTFAAIRSFRALLE